MRSTRLVLAELVGVLALSGCQSGQAPVPPPEPTDVNDVQVSETFQTMPGPAITYDQDLVKDGARGVVEARSHDGVTTVELAVRGLKPRRHYGAHAHTQQCGPRPEDSGPHFQYSLDPMQPSVDPRFANPQNEIWLDFVTDDTGAASAETTVPWVFPEDRQAGSVVIHAMPTATEPGTAGTAGARAACITVRF